MSYLDTLWTLMRWAKNGWEVHPIIGQEEFKGWI